MARTLRRFPRTARPWLLLAAGGVLAAACSGKGNTTSTATGGNNTSTGTGAAGTGGMSSTGTAGLCGNGVVEGIEECDDGMANGSANDPCQSDCTFKCIAGNPMRDHCDDGNACNGTEMCGNDHLCHTGTPLADGASCGMGKFCVNMNCVLSSCGDGIVEAPEECDDGGMNGKPGVGCDANCKFVCVANDPNRNCASTNPCVTNGTCGANHVCTSGTNVANGTACPTGVCQNGVCTAQSCAGQAKCTVCTGGFCDGGATCKPSTCGDGCVDAAAGEQCDPPNGTTCGANCKFNAVCGNGVLDPGEQCDDGNKFNLDGCDSSCKYEAVARMTSVVVQKAAAPSFCTPTTNWLGTHVLTATAVDNLNTPLQNGINSGTTNIMTQFLGLSDLTGVSSTPFTIGVLTGTQGKTGWTGSSPTNQPLDWWFIAAHSQVNSMGLPTGVLSSGMLNNRNLSAGPSDITLDLVLGGSPAALQMLSTHVAATINGNPMPNVPAPPPNQLAAGLTVFQTITGSGANQGLCGNITVASLAQIPVPQQLAQGGGLTTCQSCGTSSHTYTYCGMGQPVSNSCNSLLDVIVGGCIAGFGCNTSFGGVLVATSSQPDVPAGAAITPLSVSGSLNKVSQATAGDLDSYSAYMKFDANRAHFTGEDCAMTTDCQVGKTCNAGKCQ